MFAMLGSDRCLTGWVSPSMVEKPGGKNGVAAFFGETVSVDVGSRQVL